MSEDLDIKQLRIGMLVDCVENKSNGNRARCGAKVAQIDGENRYLKLIGADISFNGEWVSLSDLRRHVPEKLMASYRTMPIAKPLPESTPKASQPKSPVVTSGYDIGSIVGAKRSVYDKFSRCPLGVITCVGWDGKSFEVRGQWTGYNSHRESYKWVRKEDLCDPESQVCEKYVPKVGDKVKSTNRTFFPNLYCNHGIVVSTDNQYGNVAVSGVWYDLSEKTYGYNTLLTKASDLTPND